MSGRQSCQEGREMQTRISRRTFLRVTGGTVLTTSLTGCFGVGSSQSTTGGSSSSISIWDIRTGIEVLNLPHDCQVNAVKFSPDGRWLATGDGKHETTLIRETGIGTR